MSEGEKKYNKTLIEYLAGCNPKKRDYELKKIYKFQANNMRYPIPGTEYAQKAVDEKGLFTLDKSKHNKDVGLEAAMKRRREDIIEKIIKG